MYSFGCQLQMLGWDPGQMILHHYGDIIWRDAIACSNLPIHYIISLRPETVAAWTHTLKPSHSELNLTLHFRFPQLRMFTANKGTMQSHPMGTPDIVIIPWLSRLGCPWGPWCPLAQWAQLAHRSWSRCLSTFQAVDWLDVHWVHREPASHPDGLNKAKLAVMVSGFWCLGDPLCYVGMWMCSGMF